MGGGRTQGIWVMPSAKESQLKACGARTVERFIKSI